MEDGSPVLIMDVEDMVRSIEKLASGGLLARIQRGGPEFSLKKQKRVLAVDDSLTVRELERKLLTGRGYLTDVAVDGIDGWNAVRSGEYDLVLTDVDMPRMDGIELATLIKKDPLLKSLPVMIVSYKDREEDRLRGLEAGADYYLTKGSFHDETLLQAVVDLIGEPNA
jgi:two-component system sensor histidine kinase and response regulator WspE